MKAALLRRSSSLLTLSYFEHYLEHWLLSANNVKLLTFDKWVKLHYDKFYICDGRPEIKFEFKLKRGHA